MQIRFLAKTAKKQLWKSIAPSYRSEAMFFFVDSNINLMWKWYGRVKISNFLVLGVTGTQNGPLLAKKWLFWAQKKISYIFSESSFQNLMFDTKTNLLSFVDAKIWSFKNWRCAKNAKIWNAHNTPPRGPRAKKFWISKFLHRGYLHTKNDQNRWDRGVKLLTSVLEWEKKRDGYFAKKSNARTRAPSY